MTSTTTARPSTTTGTAPAVDRPDAPARHGRATWPLFGVAAGVAGLAGSMAALSTGVTEEDWQSGIAILDELEPGGFHAAFLLGLVSVMALFVTAAGWRRWADRRAPDDLAARVIPSGIVATATVNIVFTALNGSMALYLPGGTDEGWLSREAIFVNFTLLDFGTLLGWWGMVATALAVASLAFRRSRLLPRWMGVASVVLLLPALAMAAVMALPGFVGFTMPLWLVVVSLGLVLGRTAEA